VCIGWRVKNIKEGIRSVGEYVFRGMLGGVVCRLRVWLLGGCCLGRSVRVVDWCYPEES
jgi:hypothetical protein